MAWVVPTTDDSTKYDLYIGANNGVIANTNNSYLFYMFINIKTINFGTNFDTSNVTSMQGMFDGYITKMAIEKIIGLENFDTSNVTSMQGMFRQGSYTSLDLSTFDVSNVENTNCMFTYCEELIELNINNWNTSNVTNMGYMFEHLHSIETLNLCSFDTKKVTRMNGMFQGTYNIQNIYVGPNWTTANATTDLIFNGSNVSSVTTGQC